MMAARQDIRNREDVSRLVNAFYMKVRMDETLGPIFNAIVTDWEVHLSRLTDFWEGQLFLNRTYLGNPLAVHQHVDSVTEGGISPRHFGLWLNLWFETLDELYEGEVVAIAKNRARKISTMLSLKIFASR